MEKGLLHAWLPAVSSWRDRNQAAENEGAAVLLDPVSGQQIHLATEQRFQAIGQVDEAETDRLGEARQQSVTTSQPKRCRIQRGSWRASRMATTVSVRAWIS